MDQTEAEDIKKRWQEYTEEMYKKDLHDQDNHDGMITHLEPDILECEVKWALESITTSKASNKVYNLRREMVASCFITIYVLDEPGVARMGLATWRYGAL